VPLGFEPSTILLLAGISLMIILLLRRSARYTVRAKKNAKRKPSLNLKDPNREQPLHDAPPELLRWHVEMEETARNMKGEIDTKLALLQLLIARAEKAADRLEKATDESKHN
jgi:hypothetical protein